MNLILYSQKRKSIMTQILGKKYNLKIWFNFIDIHKRANKKIIYEDYSYLYTSQSVFSERVITNTCSWATLLMSPFETHFILYQILIYLLFILNITKYEVVLLLCLRSSRCYLHCCWCVAMISRSLIEPAVRHAPNHWVHLAPTCRGLQIVLLFF